MGRQSCQNKAGAGMQARPCPTSTMPYDLTQMEEKYQKIVSLEVSTKVIYDVIRDDI